MADGGASFNIDNVERFYLNSCTDLHYDQGRTAELPSAISSPNLKRVTFSTSKSLYKDDPKTSSKTISNSQSKLVPDGNKNTRQLTPLPSSRSSESQKVLKSQQSQQRLQSSQEISDSILKEKKEFTETFNRAFETFPDPVDHSWMYSTPPAYDAGDGDDGMGGCLGTILNADTANVIICGVIFIGLLSICHYI